MPLNDRHTVLLNEVGEAFVCGNNVGGALGQANTVPRKSSVNLFVQVRIAVKLRCVSAGEHHTVAVAEDGSLWGWGSNSHGQIGVGARVTQSPIPLKIPNTKDFLSIEAGKDVSLAVDSHRKLWGFGYNFNAQLGIGNWNVCYEPTETKFQNIVSVAVGKGHVIALDANGLLWGCGENEAMELGFAHDGLNKNHDEPNPVRICEEIQRVVQISCGISHTLVLDSEANVWGFGYNYEGALGPGYGGSWAAYVSTQQFKGLPPMVSVHCGGKKGYSVDTSGNVWLFHGESQNQNNPAIVPELQGMRVFPGGSHAHFINQNFEVFAVGENSFGQLGLGDNRARTTPTPIPNFSTAPKISSVKSAAHY